MARHAAARSTPQGKGKKAGAPLAVSVKRSARSKAKRPGKAVRVSARSSRARAGARARVGSTVRHMDTVVRVGTAITFAPTGERLRVAKIEDGKITFEKLP